MSLNKIDMRMSVPDGPGVILSITTPHGPVFQHTLIGAALLARCNDGELLPFTYRDPYDPDEPDAPRPLRYARLVIEEQQAPRECRGGDYCDEKCPGPGRCGT